MTPSIMLNFATEFALQNDLTVDEAKISRAYVNMLMERVASEIKGQEESVADFLRHGAGDMERSAD